MHAERIEGSFVALITPFNEDGSVDIEGFRTLLRFHEENGTVAVLIMGSSGEVSMLTPDERRTIITETAKMKTGKMKLYYGCTGPNTEATIDFVRYAGKEGADVLATGDGVVTWSGRRSGYGNLVEINHGNGYVTRYGHNKSNLVEVGQAVKKGQQIALIGSTGRSTGPHVHFEVLRNGRQVNPVKFIGR